MKCIKIYSILSNFENETTTIEAIAEYDEKENVINYTEEDLKVKIKIGKDKVLIDRKNEDYCLSLEFIPNEKVECKYEVKSIGLNLDIDVITKVLEIEKVHPHKFRRTLATMAIDKGMPIDNKSIGTFEYKLIIKEW